MGTEVKAEALQKSKRVRLLIWLAVFVCAAGIGTAAQIVLVLLGFGQYLTMQSLSDPIHRTAVLLIPAGLVVLALTWMLSELGKLAVWLKWTGRVLTSLSIVCVFGTLMFVYLFDSRLEAQGLTGQFTHEAQAARNSIPQALSDLHAFYREASVKQPGLVVEGLSQGHILTLDRKTIARKTQQGLFIWHLYRPGPPPAYLSFSGDEVYYTGPGPDFEDDIVLAVVDLSTGIMRWLFHGLGNWVSPAVRRGSLVSMVSARPSSSAIRLFQTNSPRLLWAVRVEGAIRIPPRFDGDELLVALEGTLLHLRLDTGQETDRQDVCLKSSSTTEQTFGVVCKDGKVLAWRPGKSTDERPAIHLR